MSESSTVAIVLAIISLAGTAAGALVAYLRLRGSEKVKQQKATDTRAEIIARETSEELRRLYERIEKLEATVEKLQESDTKKQKTINDQADELERTNQVLTDVRDLFSKFVTRVEEAWRDGHSMPTLTTDERRLLEDTIPRATHLTRGEHP